MKKIISTMIVSLLIISGLSSNVSAYQISAQKEQIIIKSLSPTITSKLDWIISKWNAEKTYTIYNKVKKLVFTLQMKILSDSTLTEAQKNDKIDKFNAVLYILEKHVSDIYKPNNNTWDSI